MTVLDRMGVIDEMLAAADRAKTDWRMVDLDAPGVNAVMPGEFIGGDVEILRGRSRRHPVRARRGPHALFVFDDEITSLAETASGVEVAVREAPGTSLRHRRRRRRRALRRAAAAFGPEDDYVQSRGYYYAVASGDVPLDGLETRGPDGRALAYGYSTPHRLALLGGQKAPSLFVFRADGADYDRRDTASQRAFLERHFAGVGWRVPAALEAARASSDFYLDALARTRMSAFTRGRMALAGDAGYANTLGGFGTGLALIGAYILAGELVAARGDHAAAFAAYDRRMRKPTRIARTGNAGAFLAPPSAWRIRMRDWTFANPVMFRTMMWMTDTFATDDSIPAYDLR